MQGLPLELKRLLRYRVTAGGGSSSRAGILDAIFKKILPGIVQAPAAGTARIAS